MKPHSRVALTFLTHGFAIAAGWAIYRAEVATPSTAMPESAAARTTKKADRTRTDDASGEAILAKVLKEVKQEMPRSYHPGADTKPFQVSQEIQDRIDNIEIPADFQAALETILASAKTPWSKEDRATMIALSYHWIARDPQAFFRWASSGNDPQRLQFSGWVFNVDTEIYRRSGAAGLLTLLGKADRLTGQVRADLARLLGFSGDVNGLVSAADGMPLEQLQYFLTGAARNWPDSKQAELVQIAMERDQPAMLIAYHSNRPNSGSSLLKLLEDPSLSESFRTKLTENPQLRDLLRNDPAVPLETRMRFGGNPFQMAHNDVSLLLDKERDWAFAFRKGEATAEGILAMVTAGTPGLAEREPAALRMHLFRELAEESPAKAMELLNDLPEDERGEEVLFVSRTHFDGVEPDKFLELLQQVPANTPQQWESRLDTWNRRSFTNNERLQDGYVEWVQALPPGLDRDMAHYSLARAVNESNPSLAASLRGEVVDPKLQQRIAKHR